MIIVDVIIMAIYWANCNVEVRMRIVVNVNDFITHNELVVFLVRIVISDCDCVIFYDYFCCL